MHWQKSVPVLWQSRIVVSSPVNFWLFEKILLVKLHGIFKQVFTF